MKIAILYFLEGVLLGADPKRNVSTFHMSMVDDLNMFNFYPWVTVVYDTTVDSLRGKDMAEKYRERLRKPPPQTATGREGDVHLIRFPLRISG